MAYLFWVYLFPYIGSPWLGLQDMRVRHTPGNRLADMCLHRGHAVRMTLGTMPRVVFSAQRVTSSIITHAPDTRESVRSQSVRLLKSDVTARGPELR